ncbi:hypothetical protein QBC40DRAFT_49786 [Triangularia verruculosa]|uniref:Rho-GAP domain-containing protein n=1 Tax=Triangularia verruculosa TaxID=2587418 RepID=A0AAN6XRD9_9PEZI|nr:hypothetical protein QBC40DRAFT_49786 [Triangularia verruculosa]
MGRSKPVPQPLTLPPSDDSRGETVPNSARLTTASPRSPRSPFRFGQKSSEHAVEPLQLADILHQPENQSQNQIRNHQPQPQTHEQSRHQYQHPHVNSPSQQPPLQTEQLAEKRPLDDTRTSPPLPSPGGRSADQQSRQPNQPPPHLGHRSPRHDDDKASKSSFFFNFGKAARPSDRPTTHQHPDTRAETMSKDSEHSTPSKQSTKHSESLQQESSAQRSIPQLPSRSQVSLASSADYDSPNNSTSASSSRKHKPKPFNLLSRNRSFKDKESKESKNSPSPRGEQTLAPPKGAESEKLAPLKTAPLQAHDRSFREMMSSAVRNHSAERSQGRDIGGRGRDQDGHHRGLPSSLREASGSAFFNNIKNSKAAGIISTRLFGKDSKHEPPVPREPLIDDESYVLKVINLPLVEQTRLTRISKRLEDSRDKTEFWMPAFPWRAIDYLNYKGSDVEGLYRVPGSGPQIKKWQRKFDEELDVDLFEQPDLYDINIIGSMLKAWLRELPDELFPKSAQDRIARECAGAETVPQMLIDELSNLSPFNYYLLFAITCHLSLLLAHSDKNKMDFRNLCICFQPCMKIDAFCFKFLVCDWRECWKGCKNEARFIEEEYALFDQPPPLRAIGEARRNGAPLNEEHKPTPEPRNISSSNSSKSSIRGAADNKQQQQQSRPKKKALPESESLDTGSTISTTLTINSDLETPPRKSGDLRPLSPIKPLSPLNF